LHIYLFTGARVFAGSTVQRLTTRKTSDWSSDLLIGWRGVDTPPTPWCCFSDWTLTTGTAGPRTSSGNTATPILFYNRLSSHAAWGVLVRCLRVENKAKLNKTRIYDS